jgi:hypothetical protein
MNYLAGIAALAAAFSVGVTAFADSAPTYTNRTDNSVGVTVDQGWQTVLITNTADNEVVYVNQADDVYSGATNFMLKDPTAYGKYKLLFGKSDTESSPAYFYIGMDAQKAGDIAMTRVGEESGNVGYIATISAGDYNDQNSLKVVYDNSGSTVVGGFNLKDGSYPETAGAGDVNLAFQINRVPSDAQDSISVFLSEDAVSDQKLQ